MIAEANQPRSPPAKLRHRKKPERASHLSFPGINSPAPRLTLSSNSRAVSRMLASCAGSIGWERSGQRLSGGVRR
jgi:hypothetical protein